MGVKSPAADPNELRARMVTTLRERGIFHGDAIERAFEAVPREAFLPGVAIESVYSGDAIPTKRDAQGNPISSSSEVGVMAAMIEMCELGPGHRVLEIGSGTGYNAAVLATIVGEGGKVTSLEIDPVFAREAREHLVRAGFARVDVIAADGWRGHAAAAPYDRIEVTASSADVSPDWVGQLADDGGIVMPLRLRAGAQVLVSFRKDGTKLRSASLRPGGFMPLRGPSIRPEPVTEIGGFEVTPAPLGDAARAILEALLPRKPRVVELAGPLRWDAFALIAMTVPTALGVRRIGDPGIAIGILLEEPPGLALLELAGSSFAGPLTHLIGYGSPLAMDALRVQLHEIQKARLDDFQIVARRRRPPADHLGYRLEFSRGADS
jgi:protein-L-isoaspartate(D-aspartate) O-methyltransferase